MMSSDSLKSRRGAKRLKLPPLQEAIEGLEAFAKEPSLFGRWRLAVTYKNGRVSSHDFDKWEQAESFMWMSIRHALPNITDRIVKIELQPLDPVGTYSSGVRP